VGSRTRGRPIASCCCWPPERFPPRLRWELGEIRAFEIEHARGNGEEAHDAFQEGGLARPVAPHQARARALGDVEGLIPHDGLDWCILA
jgi:hypothetical protein